MAESGRRSLTSDRKTNSDMVKQQTDIDRQTARAYSFLFVVRYTCHLMMGLSYGKVCESTSAQLALARQMIEVN